MQMTIEVPESVVKRAEELNIPVDTLVSQALNQIVEKPIPKGFVRLGTEPSTPEGRRQATEKIREIASRNTLGGLKIKDLIEEGRRL